MTEASLADSAAAVLEAVRNQQWRDLLDDSPELATSAGYPSARAWTDMSAEGVASRLDRAADRLRTLRGIDEARLANPLDRIDRRVAIDGLERDIEVGAFPAPALSADHVNGPQILVPNTLDDLARSLDGDGAAYVDRLDAVPDLLSQVIAQMRSGIDRGITLPAVIAALVPPQIDKLVDPVGLEQRLVAPLAVALGAEQPMVERARSVAGRRTGPAFEEFGAFYRHDYLPRCRSTTGLGALPEGEHWYHALARWFTTTSLMPDELAELGRGELDAVSHRRRELAMQLRVEAVDLDEPGARSAPELVAAYSALCRRIDSGLGELFGELPRLGFEVTEMPLAIAPEAPAAYYVPGSARLGRPGRFQVNTVNLDSRFRREAVALAMHECVPGHHLQFARAQENESLPPIRRHAHVDSYIEGWALYAEGLGHDLGLYADDPLSEYGAATFSAWRAARLVVDTGLHLDGWTRVDAVDFMVAETGRPRADIVVEVDRYVAWPGQALGYKVGELRIRRLRKLALEAGVDLPAFHDQILDHGAIPLAVLDDVVEAWIERIRSR